MAEKKELTPLTDPKNVLMVEVPEEEKGMSVEDAYRHLAGMPPEPVEVEAEE
jgi:hypothetical protein